jgi:hypothetical protein
VGQTILSVYVQAPDGASDSYVVNVERSEPPPLPEPVAAVTVSPDSVTVAVGETAQLSATVTDSAGTVLIDRPVSWTTGDSMVARVDGHGLVSAVAVGMTLILATCDGQSGSAMVTVQTAGGMPGLLRVDADNPRYFTDGGGRPILLTGSHTWPNLQDMSEGYPPPIFDNVEYLDTLVSHNHNFFRLWAWEHGRWMARIASEDFWLAPVPFARTGPGTANDGLPRYDVTTFNQAYFDRLRERVIAAGERGIYVSVMLFNGFSVSKVGLNNPWRGHPFNASNNVNGINGDPGGDGRGEETHALAIPTVTAIQEAYVRKVIDGVNDLDNVLYEISNESDPGSMQWQNHMIDFIRTYEASKPKQHPVGMTTEWGSEGRNADLFASSADWISPHGDIDNPPAADGSKVILSDTDHLCGVCGDRYWVWKSFLRGENPIFMDPWRSGSDYQFPPFDDPNAMDVRRNLGYVRAFSTRVNLATTTPRGDLASSGYCLARPSGDNPEYLVYLPSGGVTSVDLRGATGNLTVEWFRPSTGQTVAGGSTTGGAQRNFAAPFGGDAVLYVHR